MGNLTFMFVTPHSDDIELGTPFLYLQAIRRGHRVIEVIMTNNEFGTTRDEFKGERLKKIREMELRNANAVYEKGTNNKVETIYMDYIDGTLPLNLESVTRTADLIRQKKPDVIITCDPWYAQDFHADHLNTGRCIFFALYHLSESERPKKVIYYYSTSTDFYVNCDWLDFQVAENALIEHKSQYSPLSVKLIMCLYNRLSIFRHLLETGVISESFRLQKFKDGKPMMPEKFSEMNIYKRIINYMFGNVTIWGSMNLINKTWRDLGLSNKFDLRDTLRSKDKRYWYRTKKRKKTPPKF